MRTKRVNRYYCDWCSKGSLRSHTTAKHERGCTLNPVRVCGICSLAVVGDPEAKQKSMAVLIAALRISLESLRTAASNCPVCILAAIRQSRIGQPADWDNYYPEFEFKKELESFWNEVNRHKVDY